jgi:hypothetical protein
MFLGADVSFGGKPVVGLAKVPFLDPLPRLAEIRAGDRLMKMVEASGGDAIQAMRKLAQEDLIPEVEIWRSLSDDEKLQRIKDDRVLAIQSIQEQGGIPEAKRIQ